MENKPLMQKLNERADIRRAKRQSRRDARHQSKIMTTTYDSPISELQKRQTEGMDIEHQTTVSEGTGYKGKDASEAVELTGNKKADKTAYEKGHAEVVTSKGKGDASDQVRIASETVSGDIKKQGAQHYDVKKLYKTGFEKGNEYGISPYQMRDKASLTVTNPANKEMSGEGAKNTGRELTRKKYDKSGNLKKEKTFEKRGSGFRTVQTTPEGGTHREYEGKDYKEKGTKYVSDKRFDRIQNRFKKKWNSKAGSGASNLRQGGPEGTLNAFEGGSSQTSGIAGNLDAAGRKAKLESDKKASQSYAKLATEAQNTGTTGTKSRYVKKRNRKAARKNK